MPGQPDDENLQLPQDEEKREEEVENQQQNAAAAVPPIPLMNMNVPDDEYAMPGNEDFALHAVGDPAVLDMANAVVIQNLPAGIAAPNLNPQPQLADQLNNQQRGPYVRK
jgi:hypothetical protein